MSGATEGARVERVCAAVTRAGAIVMVLCRHATHQHWALPGGRVETGETPEMAVLRELREETGLHGTDPAPLYDAPWSDTGFERCFLVGISADDEPVLGGDPELDGGNQQIVAVAWHRLDEMRDDRQVSRVIAALGQFERN